MTNIKINSEIMKEIEKQLKEGKTVVELSKKYNINRITIYRHLKQNKGFWHKVKDLFT